MVNYRLVAFAAAATALPLNINLGAYSPALVVGDGEISFGGKQDVTQLVNALEGAAISAAANANNGIAAAAVPGGNSPAVQSAAVDPALAQQAQQIATLQGLGRASVDNAQQLPSTNNMAKRDLAGFDRALQFAEVALTKGPDIQLGTGAEGSGVGIIIDNQPTAEGERQRERRDVADESAAAPKRRAKVTTMYVRRGVPAAFQGNTEGVTAREVPLAAPAAATSQPERRDTIDSVNLNVDGDAGLTMTFVETVDGDEE
ncbi:hypothetical protein OQA88_1913 [Cercophora sp. LCS_1]